MGVTVTKGYARILGSIAAVGIGLGFSVEAQAVTYLGTFNGNDCQGGFSDCYAKVERIKGRSISGLR